MLQALVEEYIATGLPVSSQAILERSGLPVFSATIRNDVARLEAYGFVEQPHTSAGRVPTAAGYRYYVDHTSPARLRSATRSRIDSFFSDVHRELSRVLKETTGLLAEVGHSPAVVIGPAQGGEMVRALHLIPLGQSEALVVAVIGSGRVTRDVRTTRGRRRPGGARRGRTSARLVVRGPYRRRRRGTRSRAIPADATAPRVRAAVEAVAATLGGTDRIANEVYVGGTSQLVDLWQDLAHVHAILAILEQEATVRRIVDAEEPGTSVRLGSRSTSSTSIWPSCPAPTTPASTAPAVWPCSARCGWTTATPCVSSKRSATASATAWAAER